MTDPQVQIAERRKRRRLRRIVTVVGFLLFSTGMAWFFESQATTTVIVVRYADRSVLTTSDPGLSLGGQARAQELARVLGDVDVVAGIDAIFVGPTLRSQATSVPLATKNRAPVHIIEHPEDVDALVTRILHEHKGEIVLVVTEPEIQQPLIAAMHGSKKLPEFGDYEYDNLFIVTIPWFGKVKTLRLRYGAPFIPEI